MTLKRYDTAEEFLAAAGDHLLEAETENNLVLGLAGALVGRKPSDDPPPYFATVSDGDQILMCAWRTIREKVGITRATHDGALQILAEDIAARCSDAVDVLGPQPTIDAMAEILAQLTGTPMHLHMRQRIHVLEQVADLDRTPGGHLRPATDSDVDLLTVWAQAFLDDLGEPGDARTIASHRTSTGQLYVWDDGGPVSMAAWGGKTPNGVRINFVYTPPEHRNHGYATACVAELSRLMLRNGNRFCCLYTDLANPVSNSIYYRIGYRGVGESAVYRRKGSSMKDEV